MFDSSSVKVPSIGGNQFWLLVMDEYSGYLWSFFFRHRSDLMVTLTAFVKKFPRIYNKTIKRFRSDNAWENKTFQETLTHDVPYHIHFEYTAPNTPSTKWSY
jgi:hypothetical protein